MLTDKISLERDISEYLLLHHNYAAKPPSITKKSKETRIRNKYKAIRPKTNLLSTDKVTVASPVIITDTSEIIYGNIDENTNVVTVLVDSIPVDEVVTEIVTTDSGSDESWLSPADVNIDNNNTLNVPSPTTFGNSSPISSSSSDYGYESLDSPCGSIEDIWDQSVSELFPSLL